MAKHRHHRKHRSSRKKAQPLFNPNFTWDSLDAQTKKTLILAITLLFSLTSLLAGTQFMLMLAMTVGVASYVLLGDDFVHWFNQHEYLLIGAIFGLIATNFNPLGLFLGLWTGYFINRKLNQMCELGSNIVEKANPVVQPIAYTTRKLNQLFQYTKNKCLKVSNWKSQDAISHVQPSKKRKKSKKARKKRKHKSAMQTTQKPIEVEFCERIHKANSSLKENIQPVDEQEILFESSQPFTKQFEEAQEGHTTSSWKQWCYNTIETLSLTKG